MTCEGYIVAATGDTYKKGRKYRILWDDGSLFWVKYQTGIDMIKHCWNGGTVPLGGLDGTQATDIRKQSSCKTKKSRWSMSRMWKYIRKTHVTIPIHDAVACAGWWQAQG